jgi:hypothetical protein
MNGGHGVAAAGWIETAPAIWSGFRRPKLLKSIVPIPFRYRRNPTMPKGKFTTLPVFRPVPPKPALFPVGSMVCLRNCPGPHGIVRGMKRNRVIVFWPDLECIGNHFPGSLVLATEPDKTEPDNTETETEEDTNGQA